MSFQDLQRAFELIDDNGGDFEGNKSGSLIAKAEQELNVSFPPSYKKFLSVYGCGDIEGLEFYGLINEDFENSSVPDAVWLTLSERQIGLPRELILVYMTGDGIYYAIDTGNVSDNGESPIVAYELDGLTRKVYNDYGLFLLSELLTVCSE